MTDSRRAATTIRRVPRVLILGVLVLTAAATGAAIVHQLLAPSPSVAASFPSRTTGPSAIAHSRHARAAFGRSVAATVWPAAGQAAFVETGRSQVYVGPNQHAAAIASVAKVMTAYVVLRDRPLLLGQSGPTLTITDDDVADTDRRRARHESVVAVAAGEQLTELQALQALLLPSANNIAAVLASWDAGSVEKFVARMNATARSLDMTDTRYTDPSGYDADTVSTARDQVRIVEAAMRLPAFARIVATSSATLPVAGIVHNTDTLLGHDGFVGVKTGSDTAAGGCFAFRAVRWINGQRTTITGVVLGQPGSDQVAAGLYAAAVMVDRITGHRTAPPLQTGTPGAPPGPGIQR